MYYAKTNLSDVNGDLIASGTAGIKPSQLGEKEAIERYLQLGAIVKGSGEESTSEDSIIVTGEVDDTDVENAKETAQKGAKK